MFFSIFTGHPILSTWLRTETVIYVQRHKSKEHLAHSYGIAAKFACTPQVNYNLTFCAITNQNKLLSGVHSTPALGAYAMSL